MKQGNLSYRQLSYVAEAARLRSISKASDQLRISQSSIATAINQLEESFGLRIFVRQQSKGLVPTPAGREVIRRVSALLGEMESFQRDLLGLRGGLEGELHVGCFAPLSPHILPSIIRKLTGLHPRLRVHLHEGDLRAVPNLLKAGVVDVILSYDLGLPGDIAFETLTAAPPYAVFAEGEPLTRKPAVTLEDLVELPMIQLDLPESRTYFEMLFDSLGRFPRIVHRTETYEMVRALVAAGLGFSLLNMRPVIDETYSGLKVVCRPIEGPVHAPHFILGRRQDDYPSRRVEAFSACCRDYFASPEASRHIVTLPDKAGRAETAAE